MLPIISFPIEPPAPHVWVAVLPGRPTPTVRRVQAPFPTGPVRATRHGEPNDRIPPGANQPGFNLIGTW